jgi:hypothetical protein
MATFRSRQRANLRRDVSSSDTSPRSLPPHPPMARPRDPSSRRKHRRPMARAILTPRAVRQQASRHARESNAASSRVMVNANRSTVTTASASPTRRVMASRAVSTA